MTSTPGSSRTSLTRSNTSHSVARTTISRASGHTGTSTPYGTRPSRPSTAAGRRSRSGSRVGGGDTQKLICAVCEGRGVTPTVGIAFVNLTTGEAVLSQFCDNQFYARTLHKIEVFEPSEVLIVSSSAVPNAKTKMFDLVRENISVVQGIKVSSFDRKHFSETAGLDYVRQLSFVKERQSLELVLEGNFFAVCSFAAVGQVPIPGSLY